MLYIVPTPIGNLEDITYRAVKVLKEVSLVYAEDTRVTSKLLSHYEIKVPMKSLHAHNEHRIVDHLVEELSTGMEIAYVSDAGTPGISDPGFLLVQKCVEMEIPFTVLPGATSIIPAVVGSGFPCDKFMYMGFLPHKKGREKMLKQILSHSCTSIVLESPHRIVKALQQIIDLGAKDRKVVIARELSKKFEEFLRGHPQDLLDHFQQNPPKGEIVLLVEAEK